MRSNRNTVVALLALCAAGCGPSVPRDAGKPETIEEKPLTPQIAKNESDPPGDEMRGIPPHVFNPKSHPARLRHGDPIVPELASLPALKIRYGLCFGDKAANAPAQIASPSGASGGFGGGYPVKQKKSAGSQSAQAAPNGPSCAMPAAEASEKKEDAAKARSRDKDQNLRLSEGDDAAQIAIGDEEQTTAAYEDWGAAIYLSNDDTMSLSSAQRVIYAIDNFLPLPIEHIRPHELLNYFSFETKPPEPGNDFSVLGSMAPDLRERGVYSLGLAVRGRRFDKQSRRNAALTLVIDRSGSMSDEGRMDYLKQGLARMLDELKTGDMVHMVIFNHEVCVPVENFVVGRDDFGKLKRVINALKPRGSTDLHRGLSRGYEIADDRYRPEYTNRVVVITDALTNTGVTDEALILMISKYYDSRRIRLSGVGVGREFNDSLLDRLTERGKGAYVFLGSPAEVDTVFGSRFISLMETAALDVRFRLHLPLSLRMNTFYGEESSTVKEDVQEIHFFANTSQMFLSDLTARGGELRTGDYAMLSIEYKDPETEEELLEEYALNLGEISARTKNVEKARLIMTWIDILAQMAARPMPMNYRYGQGPGGLQDADGWRKCRDGAAELGRLSENISGEPEVRRVIELFDKFCTRFEKPRNPVKREVSPADDSWPGAEPRD